MTAAQRVVETARSYIGVKESPANSNNVLFNTHYYGREVYDGLWGTTFPWCCSFVWDIFRLSNCSALFFGGKKTASCPTLYTFHRRAGQLVPFEEARGGDIALMSWSARRNADHVGIVEARNGNTLTTIEGNTSLGNDGNGGMVMRRNRNKGQVLAIIRPAYDTLKEETEMSEKEINALVDAAVAKATKPLMETIADLTPKTYKTLADVPAYWHDEIAALIRAGAIKGDGTGAINLTVTEAKVLAVVSRLLLMNR